MQQSMGLQDVAGRLQSERLRLRGHIAELNDATRPIPPDCAVGRQGRVEALQSQAVLREELIAVQTRLQHIEAALSRLRRGNYGRCEACGEPIAPARLSVCPEARRCMVCAAATGSSRAGGRMLR